MFAICWRNESVNHKLLASLVYKLVICQFSNQWVNSSCVFDIQFVVINDCTFCRNWINKFAFAAKHGSTFFVHFTSQRNMNDAK